MTRIAQSVNRALRSSASTPKPVADLDPITTAFMNRFADQAQLAKTLMPSQQSQPSQPTSALDRFISVLAGPKPAEDPAQPLPLNGSGLLTQALGGAHGTVNGGSPQAAKSTASLLRQAISARYDHSG